ncbi:hypothetical protein [Paenibacillus aceti]|uniref:DUF4190 domain-containing protein n=1 Tax=Paenibacillus aceti TaxID=1820010 RepID=A0ABQ1W2J6_9BACL|nr:hypothetical protein [Paenibacillus aceti]GGG11109.1 hypothetical protein GCM10010913_36170 [Paenibacillus aceti]
MSNSRTMKWVTGSFELILGIPIIGGLIIIGTSYIPLFIMFVLHIITLVLSANNQESKYGSIVGIITSLVAWIPFVGMIMHLVTAILLMISAAQHKTTNQTDSTFRY